MYSIFKRYEMDTIEIVTEGPWCSFDCPKLDHGHECRCKLFDVPLIVLAHGSQPFRCEQCLLKARRVSAGS